MWPVSYDSADQSGSNDFLLDLGSATLNIFINNHNEAVSVPNLLDDNWHHLVC